MHDKSKLKQVAKKYHLDLIILFGSQAKGRARADSDIDVAVRALKPGWVGTRRVRDWTWRLDVIGAVGNCFRGEADVSFLNQAKPLFLYEVARHGRVLYERRAGDFTLFKIYAARINEDNEKFYRMLEQYFEKHYGEHTRSKTHSRQTRPAAALSKRARATAQRRAAAL